MQQDSSNNAGQQQQQGGGGAGPPGQMTAAQQAQYRATLIQQQQLQAMQAAVRAQQQRGAGGAQNPGQGQGGQAQQQQQQQQQFRPQQAQQSLPQQQQQQQAQARPMPNQQAQTQQQGNQNANANAQAQLQALQQLFQNNPEQLAMFVNMTKEGRLNPDQLNQLRGAVSAVQQQQIQQQQGPRPPTSVGQPARPVPNQAPQQQPQQQQQQQQSQPHPQQQQQQQQTAPQQKPIRPISQPQQATQGGQSQGRPPGGQSGASNTQEIQGLMVQIQKMAEPLVRKLKEIEAVLARTQAQGGLAPGTPERSRLESEQGELKQQQNKLAAQFMSLKAQYLAQNGQLQQSQQVQQQLALQQRAAAQQAAALAAASSSGTVPQGQAAGLAQQNRSTGTPPARPVGGPNIRPGPEQQQASRPQTPGVASAQGAPGAKGSPNIAGQQPKSTGSTTGANPSPQFQHPQVPPEAMTQRSNLISGPSNSSGMAGGSGQGPFGAGIAAQLNVQPSVPEPYPNSQGPRPTLNQGLGTNPTLGTPAILQRPDPLTGTSSGGVGGTAAASGAGAAGWEDLLGVVAKETKGGLANLTASELETVMSDPSNADFWDALTGKGTGADSLTNSGTASGNATGASGLTNADGRLLTKRKVQELVAEIDGSERLEGDVEDLLLEIADEFIDSVTHFSCKLAKHRKGDRLEVRDVQLHLERSWNLRIPTPGSVPIPPPRIKASALQSGGGAKASANAASSAAAS